MDFESIALTTRPRLREHQHSNEFNAGCYISSSGGGFFDADPGNPQHCKFPRSLTSVSLSSLNVLSFLASCASDSGAGLMKMFFRS